MLFFSFIFSTWHFASFSNDSDTVVSLLYCGYISSIHITWRNLRPVLYLFFYYYYICTHFLKGNYSRNSFLLSFWPKMLNFEEIHTHNHPPPPTPHTHPQIFFEVHVTCLWFWFAVLKISTKSIKYVLRYKYFKGVCGASFTNLWTKSVRLI